MPGQVLDTVFIDDDPSLGGDFHNYYVVAVDDDGYVSDTTGSGAFQQKAALLQADRILAINRSSISYLAYVDESETGRFMRDALDGWNFDYASDTIHTSPSSSTPLRAMIDYGLMVIGCESARQDDIGAYTSLGGILDSLGYYLSIGGKLIIFGRWGDISVVNGEVDTIFYEPGYYDSVYTDYFNIVYRIIPKTYRYLAEYYSDFVGATSRKAGYPDLEWDSLQTIQHSLPVLMSGIGIPAPSLPVFAGADIDTIYTYKSHVDSVLTQDHPIAWHYDGNDFEYIYFEIPLSFMKRDAAITALRQAVTDIMNPTAVDDRQEFVQIPSAFTLAQNYPNPFNPGTTLEFYNSGSMPVDATLEVFNILGQSVKVIFDGKALPGVNKVEWDGRDADNRPVASGIYFYRLKTNDISLTRKMILLK